MRISVRLCSKAFRGSLEFSRSVRRAPNAPKVGTLSRMFSLPTSSPREAVLEVVGAVKKKRKLSLGRRPASSRSFRVTASSEQNAGILTRFPFVAGNDLLRTCPKTRPIVPFSKLILGGHAAAGSGEEFSVCVTVIVRIPLLPEVTDADTASGWFVVEGDRYVNR
jgi:hypothetical protein